MSNKNQHFISIITPTGDSTLIDMELTAEEYELVNRISSLFFDQADATEPILTISKPVAPTETVEQLNTNPIEIIKPEVREV